MKVNRDPLPKDVMIVVVPVTGRGASPEVKYIHLFNFAAMFGDKQRTRKDKKETQPTSNRDIFCVFHFGLFFPGNQEIYKPLAMAVIPASILRL